MGIVLCASYQTFLLCWVRSPMLGGSLGPFRSSRRPACRAFPRLPTDASGTAFAMYTPVEIQFSEAWWRFLHVDMMAAPLSAELRTCSISPPRVCVVPPDQSPRYVVNVPAARVRPPDVRRQRPGGLARERCQAPGLPAMPP